VKGTGLFALAALACALALSDCPAEGTGGGYALSYDANGGTLSGGTPAGNYAGGEIVWLPSSGSKAGYVLTNFTLDTTGVLFVGTQTTPGSTFMMPAGAVTATAEWTLLPLTGAVAVTGAALVGETLAADTSALDGSGTIYYQWKRAGSSGGPYSDIAGAADSTYAPVAADIDKYLKVAVTRTDRIGTITSETAVLVPGLIVTGTGWAYDSASEVYTISDGGDVTATGSTTSACVVVNGTAAVTLDGVSITDVGTPLSLGSGANVTLRLAGTSRFSSGPGGPGIDTGAGTLTIVSAAGGAGSSEGTLNVFARESGYMPGIYTGNGVLYILGGTVHAMGGHFVGGIGGGSARGGDGITTGGGKVHINHPSGESHGSASAEDGYTGIGPGENGSGGKFYGPHGPYDEDGWPTDTTYEW
jgi:hypothetical protein